jgi:hypothetical protein
VLKDGRSGAVVGHVRLGAYSPAPDATTLFGVIDCDGGSRHGNPLADPLGTALAILDSLERLGIHGHLEQSGGGRGWHVWVFFTCPVPASRVRRLLFAVVPGDAKLVNGTEADARRNAGIEVFPKQNHIAVGGLGNMVWLPWWHGARGGANQFHQIRPGGELLPSMPNAFWTVSDAELREALGRLPRNPPAEDARLEEDARPRAPREAVPPDCRGSVQATYLLWRALARVAPGRPNGRNDTGLWLACQLRDNGCTESQAAAVMCSYASRVPLGPHPYTEDEALATLASAYLRPRREPWSNPASQRRGVGRGGWHRHRITIIRFSVEV